MTTKDKISHPFKVPSGFHDAFKLELVEKIEQERKKKQTFKIKQYTITVLKYAAIIAVAFFVGRFSQSQNNNSTDVIDVETIYNQVSEDNIIEYVIEDEIIVEL